jgi:hypothetical protein
LIVHDAVKTGDEDGEDDNQNIDENLFHRTHAYEPTRELSHARLTMSTFRGVEPRSYSIKRSFQILISFVQFDGV